MTRRSPIACCGAAFVLVFAHAARAEDAASPSWSLDVSGGAGFGTRELALPEANTVYRTRTGVFPAAELGFELNHEVAPGVRLGLCGRYQTSVGLHILERHTDGSERRQGLRSHRFELAFTSAFDLAAKSQWVLFASLGYGLVDVRPEVHLLTPGYGLGGPYLRVELQIPLGSERLRLRVGPEGQWIVQVGDELAHRGIDGQGVGAGGSALLELAFTHVAIDVGYRELRAFLGSTSSHSFTDASRFVTARVRGTL